MKNQTATTPPFSVPLEETILEISDGPAHAERATGRTVPENLISFGPALQTAEMVVPAHERYASTKVPSYRLTDKGRQAERKIRTFREKESQGLPISAWNPARQPNLITLNQWLEYAIYETADDQKSTPTHHTDGALLLRGRHPLPDRLLPDNPTKSMRRLLNPENWNCIPTKPIGYFFNEATAIIAFDQEDLYVEAAHYELMCLTTMASRTWYALTPNRANRFKNGEAALRTLIRTDDSKGTYQAIVPAYHYDREQPPPGIARILNKRNRRKALADRR